MPSDLDASCALDPSEPYRQSSNTPPRSRWLLAGLLLLVGFSAALAACGGKTLTGANRSVCEAPDDKRDDCWLHQEFSDLHQGKKFRVQNAADVRKLCRARCGKAKSIHISYEHIGDLEFLSGMTGIDNLEINGSHLRTLEGLEQASVYELFIERAHELTSLEGLSGSKLMGKLHLRNSESLETLDGPSNLERVEYLKLQNLPALSDLSELADSPVEDPYVRGKYGNVRIRGADSLTDLGGLKTRGKLTRLKVADNEQLERLELDGLKRATYYLQIFGNPNLPSCLADRLGKKTAPLYGPKITTEDNGGYDYQVCQGASGD